MENLGAEIDGGNYRLIDELGQLVSDLEDRGYRIIIGGGLGLWILERNRRATATLSGRSTKDIDILLPKSTLEDAGAVKALRDTISELGYEPDVPYMQFEKKDSSPGADTRVEVLACWGDEIPEFAKVKGNRFSRRDVGKFHGYYTPAGAGIEIGLIEAALFRNEPSRAHLRVSIPSLFNFVIMKLYAASDRLKKDEPDLVGKHCLDIFRTVLLMEQADWRNGLDHFKGSCDEDYIRGAVGIRVDLFADQSSPGIQALARTEQYQRRAATLRPKVPTLVNDLKELLPE